MGHSNGRITAPVGVDTDIAPVLGVGSYDAGYLCSNAHGKINRYAACKPLDYSQYGELTDTDRSAKNYGLTFNAYTTLSDLMSALAAGNKYAWTYVPPATTYRVLDFEGYNHQAVFPIGESLQTTYYIVSGQTSITYWDYFESGSIDIRKMQANGASMSGFYFGVYLKPRSNAALPSKVVTANMTIGGVNPQEDPYLVYLDGMSQTEGDYLLYTFLSSVRLYGTESTSVKGIFVPLPYPAKNIATKNSYVGASFSVNWFNDAGTAVEFLCHLINNTSSTRQTGLIILRLKKGRTADSATVTDTLTFPSRELSPGEHSPIEGTIPEIYEVGWSYFLEVMSTATGTVVTYVGEP